MSKSTGGNLVDLAVNGGTISAVLYVQPGEKIIRHDGSVYKYVPTEGWVFVGHGWDAFVSTGDEVRA